MNRIAIYIACATLVSSTAFAEVTAPAQIMETAKAMAPGATFSDVGTDYDTQRMMPEYEVKGKSAAGVDLEVDLSVNGDLLEIETVIAPTDVPAPVMGLLKVYLPDFQASKIELSQRPNNVNFYEFEGVIGGREVDIEVDATGNIIMIADDKAV
jgi:uncharacterized membrane protein YkoI